MKTDKEKLHLLELLVNLTACALHGGRAKEKGKYQDQSQDQGQNQSRNRNHSQIRQKGFPGISSEELTDLYRLAGAHTMTSVICMGLEETGVLTTADPEMAARWENAKNQAIRKCMLLDAGREEILAEMEQAGIWYLPLKGVILEQMYPRYGMRQMADNDILYDASRQQDVKDIFLAHGYRAESVGKGVHDIYQKPPVYNYEMHTALFSESLHMAWAKEYQDVKGRLLLDEGKKFGYHFTDEDCYVYLMAHAYKHFSHGGTGLRTLADVWVYHQKKGGTMDRDYVERELGKLGILDFERKIRTLSGKLFDRAGDFSFAGLTEEEQELFLYVSGAGTYGTSANWVKNQLKSMQADEGQISRGTKLRYCLSRLFPGREWFRDPYPFVYRHPYLIPFMWIYRIVRGALFRRRKLSREIQNVAHS